MYKDRINIILEAIDVIDENSDSDTNLIKLQIEDKLGYTYAYISELFKNEIGITAHDYIKDCKSNVNKKAVNELKSELQNKVMAVESLNSKIIKKKRVKGEEIQIEIDHNELFSVMLKFPIIVYPKNDFIDQLLYQFDYGDFKETIVPLYVNSIGFILRQKDIELRDSEIEYMVNISCVYDYRYPTIYSGLYIFTPFNRLRLKYSNSKRRMLNKQEMFRRIATIFNLKVFDNNIPNTIVENESKLRLTLIFIITKQYYDNNFENLNELILHISRQFSYESYEIYDKLIELINQGIIVFVTDIQQKYFYNKDIKVNQQG